MQDQSILQGADYNYLGEFLEDLPDNCYFNKVLTGCGGTTVALTNNVNYVICVPFISLIQNKLDQVDNAFGFYGGVKTDDLQNYLSDTDVLVKKILVTYDSLAKLIEYINPQEYKLLIDEAHKLLDSASFRFKAVKSVMQNYEKFNSYVFMTATPVQDKYQLPELACLPKVEIDWGDIVPVKLSKVKANTPAELYDYTILTAIKHLDGELDGAAYFFMNSVTKITDLVKKLKELGRITSDDVRIVCADTEENKDTVNKKLGYEIEKASSKSKKLNFCTSTAFEGSDIYCKDGVTYIVSDGFRTHTKYDILTTIPQIVGRIRNSIYKNEVSLFYYDSPYYSYVSPEEYAVFVKSELDASKKMLEDYEQFSTERGTNDKTLKAIKAFAITDPYICQDGDLLEIAAWSWHAEMHNYEVVNTSYSVRLQGIELVNKTPYQYSNKEIELQGLEGISKLRIGKVPQFASICKDYVELRNKKIKTKEIKSVIKAVEVSCPVLKEAYDKLGEDIFSRVRYSKKKLETELLKVGGIKDSNSIRKLLKFEVGQRYSYEEIKKKILNLPLEFRPIKCTATTINDYYLTKPTKCKQKDKWVNGYIILGIK